MMFKLVSLALVFAFLSFNGTINLDLHLLSLLLIVIVITMIVLIIINITIVNMLSCEKNYNS